VAGGESNAVGDLGWTEYVFNEYEHIFTNQRKLTTVDPGLTAVLPSKLDINEVNLELLVRLNTNKERRTTARSDGFIGEMLGLEDERKGTLQFLEYCLDQFGKCYPLVALIVEIFRQNCDGFSVGLGLEFVPALLEDQPQFSAVSHNTIMDDTEFVVGIRPNGVAVDF
jgi:hypothetical protein